MASLVSTFHVCYEVERLVTALSPPSQPRYRSIASVGKQRLRHDKHFPWLEMSYGLLVGEPVLVPTQDVGFGCTQNIVPTPVLHNALQIDAIKFSISKEHDIRLIRDHPFNTLNQFHVLLFAEVPFFLFFDQPSDGQRSLLVDDSDHESHAAPPNDGPINHQDQCGMGQCPQDLLNEREEEDGVRHVLVL